MGDRYPFIIGDREPPQFWFGTDRGAPTKFERRCELGRFAFIIGHREPYRTNFDAVRFAVLKSKRITVPILVQYGWRSYTKKRTIKIKGSVRLALLTVRQKNGTLTVALAVKNGKRYGHGMVRTRYGTATVRTRYGTVRTPYGPDTVTNSDPLL